MPVDAPVFNLYLNVALEADAAAFLTRMGNEDDSRCFRHTT